jgi:hypothetical protein
VLLEFIGEENTVVTRILQQVSQFVILSVTQRKTNPTVSTHLLPSPAQDQKKDEMFQSK